MLAAIDVVTASILIPSLLTVGGIAGAVGAYYKNRGKPNGKGNGAQKVCKRHEALQRSVDQLPCGANEVRHEQSEKEIAELFVRSKDQDARIGVNERIAVEVRAAVTAVQKTVTHIEDKVLPTLATKSDIESAMLKVALQARGND